MGRIAGVYLAAHHTFHTHRSGPTDTGMRRLSLDDNDAKARTWFVEETGRLGCTRHVVDEVRQGDPDESPSPSLMLPVFFLHGRWATSLRSERDDVQVRRQLWAAI